MKENKERSMSADDWKIAVDTSYEKYHGTHEHTIISMHSATEGVAIALSHQQVKELIRILVDQL